MKLEITKNYKDGNRHYLKGRVFEVPQQMLPWKANELIEKKVAKYQVVKEKKVETI